MNQASGAGPVGQTRNPVMVLLISMVCAFYGLFQLWTMMNELKAYLNKDEIQAWHVLIPYYNLYLLWIKVPKWIGEAKQRAGSANPQPAVDTTLSHCGLQEQAATGALDDPQAAVERTATDPATARFGAEPELKVFDIWESREAIEAFAETMRPIMLSVGVDPGQPEVGEVHNTIAG